ncbi:MAG: hypothetical protein KIS94_01085 [Chitinophagales bacterium]|nr:hypothetical protein [Chitinophagales bacterium]
MQRLTTFLFIIFTASTLYAQNFAELVGKDESSEEFKNFVSAYKLEQSTAARYQSGEGIEVILKDGKVFEIHLHKESSIYGNYTGALPSKLNFAMNTNEVKQVLGKPTTAYTSSGYNEYVYDTHILSCWFENGILSQVVVSAK